MKRSFIHKVLLGFLVCLVLILSTGWAIDFHYCGGHVKSVGLNKKASSCQVQLAPCTQENKSCHQSSVVEQGCQKGCCNNETVTLDSEDYTFDLAAASSLKCKALFSWVHYIQIQPSVSLTYLNQWRNPTKAPPRLNQSIVVMVQSFLL